MSSATVLEPARIEPNRHIAGVDQSPRDIGRRDECAFPDGASDGDPLVFALRDGFPVAPGHVLVIPHRHVGSFFETTPEERSAILESLDLAKQSVEQAHRPDGDRPNPRGGVRWVLPEKADYWTKP